MQQTTEQIKEALFRMGFTEDRINQTVSSLSGGWLMKLSLSRAISDGYNESAAARKFREFDVDGNGYLDRREFKTVMSSAELDLSAKDIRQIMAQCDENGDGQITLGEIRKALKEMRSEAELH